MSIFDRRYELMPRAELEQLPVDGCRPLLPGCAAMCGAIARNWPRRVWTRLATWRPCHWP